MAAKKKCFGVACLGFLFSGDSLAVFKANRGEIEAQFDLEISREMMKVICSVVIFVVGCSMVSFDANFTG